MSKSPYLYSGPAVIVNKEETKKTRLEILEFLGVDLNQSFRLCEPFEQNSAKDHCWIIVPNVPGYAIYVDCADSWFQINSLESQMTQLDDVEIDFQDELDQLSEFFEEDVMWHESVTFIEQK